MASATVASAAAQLDSLQLGQPVAAAGSSAAGAAVPHSDYGLPKDHPYTEPAKRVP